MCADGQGQVASGDGGDDGGGDDGDDGDGGMAAMAMAEAGCDGGWRLATMTSRRATGRQRPVGTRAGSWK